jgi:hypothetical protein
MSNTKCGKDYRRQIISKIDSFSDNQDVIIKSTKIEKRKIKIIKYDNTK